LRKCRKREVIPDLLTIQS